MRNAGKESESVLAEDLQIPLGPAHPLPPGLGKVRGLLVVEHRARRVADLVSAHDIIDGELDILGQQEEVPAAALPQHLVGKEKARAGHGATAAKAHPRVVEILRLAQKPQRVARRDPVVAVVFGVAVAGHDLIAGGVDLLDLGDKVRVKDIVGIQHKIGVVMPVTGTLDALQKLIEHVALTHLLGIEALIDGRTMRAGHARRVIRAVVRTDKNVHAVHGIGLCADAVEQLPDHVLLVARRDEHGNAVVFVPTLKFSSPQQRHSHIIKLIGIAQEKERHDDGVDGFDGTHSISPHPLRFRPQRHSRSPLWKAEIVIPCLLCDSA